MISQILYKWTTPIFSVNAQKAGTTLENIIIKRSLLKPSFVVEESADKYAPLYKSFDWNDKTAAEKYRSYQAQELIKNLSAVKIGHFEQSCSIRAFIDLKQESEYVSVVKIMNSSELREIVLDEAIKELEEFYCKYASLEFLSELMTGIDKTIKKYQRYVDM